MTLRISLENKYFNSKLILLIHSVNKFFKEFKMKKINSSKSLKKATAFGAHPFETWDAVVSKDEITLCEQWPNIVRKLFCIKLVQMFVYCLQSVISPYNVVKFGKLNISKNKTFSIKSFFDVGRWCVAPFQNILSFKKKTLCIRTCFGPNLNRYQESSFESVAVSKKPQTNTNWSNINGK